jgi:hypothetical protein
MGHPMPAQHTSVVVRPHFNPRQTLLAFAMAAVLALGAGVVILANDADQVASTNRIAPAVQQSQTQLPAGTRFDGGPEEGTRGPRSYYESPNQRSSYQPAPADGFKARAGGPTMIPQGPAAR